MTQYPAVEQHPGFKLIRIHGGPYERGLQHGRLLRDDVHRLRDAFYRDIIYFNGRLFGTALRSVIAPILAMMHRHISTELRLEMRGVARGAGISYQDILTFNCFDDLLHSLWLIPPILSKLPFGRRFCMACSSFALMPERTRDGRMLHGRNLDYEVVGGLSAEGSVPQKLKENVAVIEVHPDRGQSYLSIGWPGVVGVVTSINQAGLSLACLTSTIHGETPNGLPLPLLYRSISQYARTFADAERLIRACRLTIGNNLVLAAAAEKEARVYELSPRLVAIRRPTDGFITATNHFSHEALVPRQNGWVVPTSVDRCSRLTDLCAVEGCGPAEAGAFLRDTISTSEEANPWGGLENPGTIYSSVTEPESGRLWLRVNDRPEREFVEITPSWNRQAVAA